MSEVDYTIHPYYRNLKISKQEVWKWVVGWKGWYKVSNYGRVKSVDRIIYYDDEYGTPHRRKSVMLKPDELRNGYLMVRLKRNQDVKASTVHRLVLEAFVGPCPEGMQCRHLDGNKKNNHLENLCWGTKKQNANDRIRHGTDPVGERNPRVKLTEEKVKEIRRLYATGKYSQEKLGKMFGVCQTTIDRIVRRVIWRNV